MRASPAEQPGQAVIRRLHALTPLDVGALQALAAAADRPRSTRAKREMLAEGQEISAPLFILSGWAARQRVLEDGRRQIIDIVLPGDLIGQCGYDRPLMTSSVLALTDVVTCVAPDASLSPALARAYALSRALSEAYLCAQVTRLGRMNAQDRIADLLLEIFERLEFVGLAERGRFALPLTQEMIADAVGLTSVHVNRSLQALRRDGAIDLKGRDLAILNPDVLRRNIGRAVPRVSVSHQKFLEKQ